MKLGLLHLPASKKMSWILVAICCLAIFFTIPLARAIQRGLEGLLGVRSYVAATVLLGAFFVLLIFIYLRQRGKTGMWQRLAWMGVLGALSGWIMRYQLQSPAEAIHFIEYSLLGFLFFRAWSHHIHDWLIYPVCILSVAVMAFADEFVQWMVPGRFWDYRDIRLNLMAGVIMQLFIAQVISPSSIFMPAAARSFRWFCRMAWLTLVLMGLSISNTPARVDLYSARIPFLQFLKNTESIMSEYGYRHEDPEIGVFYSRMTLDELARIDLARGKEAGAVVRRYQSFADYREFIQTFTSSVDPFLHEMRVHLHRRDHYYNTGWQYPEKDPVRFRHHMTVAWRENQILETYFGNTLRSSGGAWNEDQRTYSRQFANLEKPYTSEVSDHLVTAATESELWIILALGALATGFIYVRYGLSRRM